MTERPPDDGSTWLELAIMGACLGIAFVGAVLLVVARA